LLSIDRLDKIDEKRARIARWIQFFQTARTEGGTWADRIRREGQGIELPADFVAEARPIRDEVMYRIGYEGYLAREERQIKKMERVESVRIPPSLDYLALRGLRRESAIKLSQLKPYTLGQAGRISGVNPADVSVLMIAIEALSRA
jgi:tRNA uridine 5-carboxymethylaminomethyl modification enzyme